MPHILFMCIEAAVLAASLSLDAFTAGFSYGSNKIKIPMRSVQIINGVCAGILGLFLFLGGLLRPYLPPRVLTGAAFLVLFVMGLIKVLDGVTKSLIRKHTTLDKSIHFSLFNFKFILRLYADPEAADADVSGNISSAEAVALAVSLSLDSVAVGLGAAMMEINRWALLGFSLITNMAAILLGVYLGHKLTGKLPFNISWLGGAVLMGLAVLKLR